MAFSSFQCGAETIRDVHSPAGMEGIFPVVEHLMNWTAGRKGSSWGSPWWLLLIRPSWGEHTKGEETRGGGWEKRVFLNRIFGSDKISPHAHPECSEVEGLQMRCFVKKIGKAQLKPMEACQIPLTALFTAVYRCGHICQHLLQYRDRWREAPHGETRHSSESPSGSRVGDLRDISD